MAVRSLHEDMFENMFNLLLEKGLFFNSEQRRSETPFKYQCPRCLRRLLDFKVNEIGENHTTLMEYLEEILKFSPRVSHPFYLAKSGAG